MLIPYADDNPTIRVPYITIGVIAACVVVFLYQLTLPDMNAAERFIAAFAMIPAELFGYMDSRYPGAPPGYVTIVTSMFLHGSLLHLGGNMLYLWVFGNNIEDSMGPARFVVFYLLCGFAAAMAQALMDPTSEIPMIGASGAISGVLGAYLVLHPSANVRNILFLGIFFFWIRLPAVAVLGFWIVVQAINASLASNEMGGVAWYAHLGGFVAGMVLIPLFRDPRVPLFGGGRSRGPWG
jgi:membrane associated rhomboid family serine protease